MTPNLTTMNRKSQLAALRAEVVDLSRRMREIAIEAKRLDDEEDRLIARRNVALIEIGRLENSR